MRRSRKRVARCHRGLLGGVELRQRPGKDALATPERREVGSPRREPLGQPGDLLGVHRVLLHARPGGGLVVARAVRHALGVARPRPRGAPGPAAPSRSARAPRARPSSARSRAAAASRLDGSVSGCSSPMRPASRARLLVDLGDVRLLGGKALLGLRRPGQVQLREHLIALDAVALELLLHVGAPAQPPRHLLVLHLARHAVRVALAEAEPRDREARPGRRRRRRRPGAMPRFADAGERRGRCRRPRRARPTPASPSPIRESGCHLRSGGSSKLTWTSLASASSSVAIRVSRVRSRSTAGRSSISGHRRGVAWRRARPARRAGRWPPSSGRSGPARRPARRAGARPDGPSPAAIRRSVRADSASARRSLASGVGLAVALEACQPVLADREATLRVGHRLGALCRAGQAPPLRGARSAIAAARRRRARAGAPVGTAHRGRRAGHAGRPRPAGGRRARSGAPTRSSGGSPRWARRTARPAPRRRVPGPRRPRRRARGGWCPQAPAKTFARRPSWTLAVLVVPRERDGDGGSAAGGAIPTSAGRRGPARCS